MNKLLIPSILTVIVLIAGLFAFMPIEKATTVHATIIAAAGIITLVEENVVLPVGGTNVIFTFTADSDSMIQYVGIDNTPTCNPTSAGVCATSDEDFTPTFDGDTIDEPLCTISANKTFDDSPNDASDDRYTLWRCDDSEFFFIFADITREDGQRLPLQGIRQAGEDDLANNDTLALRDILRFIGQQTSDEVPLNNLPVQDGESISFVFDAGGCSTSPVIVDFIVIVTGSGTLNSAEVAGSSDSCI